MKPGSTKNLLLRLDPELAGRLQTVADVEGRHVLCPDDADRPPSRTTCQRAGFDHGHGNAALNQVERTGQAERTPADDYDMQRAHSLDGSM